MKSANSKTSLRRSLPLLLALVMLFAFAACSNAANATANTPAETAGMEEQIKERLYTAWDEWLPGYDDWLN